MFKNSLTSWRPFQALGGLSPARDLVAGLTLAAIAAPEQMATARLGGFSPQIGLFAFVVASLGFAVFGSNRRLSAGADSTITPIFAASLAAMAATGAITYAPAAAALALMVGVLVVMAGLFRLGWMADLLSRPILTGFLAGIALHIVLSQAPAVLGLPDQSGSVYHRLAGLAAQAGAVQPAALAIGLGVFAVTFMVDRLSPRAPAALLALVAASVATAVFQLRQHGVAVLAVPTASLPPLGPPALGVQQLAPLVGLALVIALIVMVQTAATSRSFPGQAAEPDINRDFVGIGAASVLAGLAGAFPVNASPPRTAVVSEAGGNSQWAGLTAAALVVLLATAGAGLIGDVPTAALGGILLFVAERIFRARDFVQMIRQSPAEFALAAVTAVAIVLLPIQTGVAVGVFLSLAHGVFTITRARPIPFEPMAGTTVWWPVLQPNAKATGGPVMVMGFQAPLSFLNAEAFRHGMLQAIAAAPADVRLFVLEASSIVEIDFTAAGALLDVVDKARARGMDFAVARLASVRARAAFDRFGLSERLGADHMFHSVDAAIRALAPAPLTATTDPSPSA